MTFSVILLTTAAGYICITELFIIPIPPSPHIPSGLSLGRSKRLMSPLLLCLQSITLNVAVVVVHPSVLQHIMSLVSPHCHTDVNDGSQWLYWHHCRLFVIAIKDPFSMSLTPARLLDTIHQSSIITVNWLSFHLLFPNKLFLSMMITVFVFNHSVATIGLCFKYKNTYK